MDNKLIGVYKDMSIEEYHSHEHSYSRSKLMDYKRSAYYYWAKNIKEPEKKSPTKAMVLGNAFHTLVMEPHLFQKQFATKPERVLLKDVGRDAYDVYLETVKDLESTNKMILSPEDCQLLSNMKEAMDENENTRQMIEGGVYEQSYFWEDRHTNLIVKARPDIKHDNFVVDIKTCADASPFAFQRKQT